MSQLSGSLQRLMKIHQLRETLGLFYPYTGFIRYPFDPAILTNIDYEKDTLEQIRLDSAYYHEFVHHLQSIGTTFAAGLHWNWGLLKQAMILYCRLQGYRAAQGLQTHISFKALLNSDAKDLTDLTEILMISSNAGEVALARLNAKDFAEVGLDNLPSFSNDSKFLPAPYITNNGSKVSLTGRTILEGQAASLQIEELNYAKNYGLSQGRLDQLLKLMPTADEYWVARRLFKSSLPESHSLDFYLLLDYALNSKVIPVPKTKEEWIETHPGYRFERALRVYKSVQAVDWDLGLKGQDWDTLYESIRNWYTQISKKCDFVDFQETHGRDLDFLKMEIKRGPAKDDRGIEVGPLSYEHDYLRFKALSLRNEHPILFITPAIRPEIRVLMKDLSPYFFAVGRQFIILDNTEYDPLYLQSFASVEMANLAFAAQFFQNSASSSELFCHANLYDIENVCPHYGTRCDGVINISEKWPSFPGSTEDELNDLCPFGEILRMHGLNLSYLIP